MNYKKKMNYNARERHVAYLAGKFPLRSDVINHLIQKYHYKTYLEIGTQNPAQNFDKIIVEHKECIDPKPLRGIMTYECTSDEAFKQIKASQKTYDIIFVDGLHKEAQVDKDFENSLSVLNPGGTIVAHDCNPPAKGCESFDVNGTCWRSYAKLRTTRADLFMCVVDTDWGCAVIRKGSQSPYVPTEKNWLSWNYFEKNRIKLMNLISWDDFISLSDHV